MTGKMQTNVRPSPEGIAYVQGMLEGRPARPENLRIQSIKKRETGKGRELMASVKARYRNNPLQQISAFLEAFPMEAAIGRKRAVSFGTREAYHDRLNVLVKGLSKLNMPIQNLDEVTAKQVKRLFQEFERQGRSPGWMRNLNTSIRRFGVWIGKPDLCPSVDRLVVNPENAVRRTSAIDPQDWEARGIEVDEVIARLTEICEVTGAQLRLAAAFGVRFQEFLMFRPFEATKHPGFIYVTDGTKGGRPRNVPIETDEQREAIAIAKRLAGQNKEGIMLAKEGLTLEHARSHARYNLTKAGVTKAILGITPHGLRHRYACTIYKQLTGELAPVLGGKEVDPIVRKQALKEISERLGHCRIEIVSAYVGNHRTLHRYKAGNLERLTAKLHGDDILNQMAQEAGITEINLFGEVAAGNAVKPGQSLPIGFSAKRANDETQMEADMRATPNSGGLADRIGVLLNCKPLMCPMSAMGGAAVLDETHTVYLGSRLKSAETQEGEV